MKRPDAIRSKNPDEIKKGLESCILCWTGPEYGPCHTECIYRQNGLWCRCVMNEDALSYIRQLQYALLLMISQYCTEPDETTVTHRFMSAGEHAFEVLGIKASHISTDELEAMIERLEKEMYPK